MSKSNETKKYYVAEQLFSNTNTTVEDLFSVYINAKIDNIIEEGYNRTMTEATSKVSKEVVEWL